MKYLALTLPGGNSVNTTLVPTGGTDMLTNIISVALNLAIIAAIIICLFMLIWGGFDWITSEGDKQKVANARQRLAMAIIGLIVVFLSFMIVNIVSTFFFGAGAHFF
jgi:TRAP-type C4-dicarboxylate transport system permease small subunit